MDDNEAGMSNVGYALMQAISIHADKGWSPADCPSEIVGDMRLQRDEALEKLASLRMDAMRYRVLRDENAWGDDAPKIKRKESAWGELGELHGGEFDAYIDDRFKHELGL